MYNGYIKSCQDHFYFVEIVLESAEVLMHKTVTLNYETIML